MHGETAILSYFVVTGIAMLVLLVLIARRFGRDSVRAYSASSEEALRARNLLKDWAGEGFLTAAQYQRMEQETVCDLRRTNIFLRLVLFLFTLIIVGAAVGLFFVVFLSQPPAQTTGIFLLIFAAISYAAAEFAVSQARLYRYGIEEALAVCSVGFLCVGMQVALFSGRPYSRTERNSWFPPPAPSLRSGYGIASGSPMHFSPR